MFALGRWAKLTVWAMGGPYRAEVVVDEAAVAPGLGLAGVGQLRSAGVGKLGWAEAAVEAMQCLGVDSTTVGCLEYCSVEDCGAGLQGSWVFGV